MKYLCLIILFLLIIYSLIDKDCNNYDYEKECPECDKNYQHNNLQISSIVDFEYHKCPKCNKIWCSNDDE